MSSKDVHVRWLKDGCDITASRRYVFMREGKRAEVIIEDCELTDEGEYSVVCTQDNDAHEYVTSASLTVDGNDFCQSGVLFHCQPTCIRAHTGTLLTSDSDTR